MNFDTPLFVGAVSGLAAGAALLFLSHLAPLVGAGNFIRDVDEPRVHHHALTRREAHLLGMLLHLLLSLVFGATYGWFVSIGLASGFRILPLLGWAFVLALVTGVVVMPLGGHGLFGRKHDAWFLVDALVTNALWALVVAGFALVWAVN